MDPKGPDQIAGTIKSPLLCEGLVQQSTGTRKAVSLAGLSTDCVLVSGFEERTTHF